MDFLLKKYRTITIGIKVKNLAESDKWYKTLLGELERLTPVDGILELKLDEGIWLQLIEKHNSKNTSSIIRLEVRDLKVEKDRLEKYLIPTGEIQTVEGVISYFEFQDLDGNNLSFYQLL